MNEFDIQKAFKALRENMQQPRYKYFMNDDDRKALLSRANDPQYMSFIEHRTVGAKFIESGKVIGVPEDKLQAKFDAAFERVMPKVEDLNNSFGLIRSTFVRASYAFDGLMAIVRPQPKKGNPNWSMEWDNWRNTGVFQWAWMNRVGNWINKQIARLRE